MSDWGKKFLKYKEDGPLYNEIENAKKKGTDLTSIKKKSKALGDKRSDGSIVYTIGFGYTIIDNKYVTKDYEMTLKEIDEKFDSVLSSYENTVRNKITVELT